MQTPSRGSKSIQRPRADKHPPLSRSGQEVVSLPRWPSSYNFYSTRFTPILMDDSVAYCSQMQDWHSAEELEINLMTSLLRNKHHDGPTIAPNPEIQIILHDSSESRDFMRILSRSVEINGLRTHRTQLHDWMTSDCCGMQNHMLHLQFLPDYMNDICTPHRTYCSTLSRIQLYLDQSPGQSGHPIRVMP
eukprot:g45876.t1